MDLPHAIAHCRPGASWSLDGNTYDGIRWHDTKQKKPTLEELKAAWAELQNPPAPVETISVPGAAFFQAIGRDMEIRLRAKIAEETDLNRRHFLAAFLSYPYFQSDHPMVLQFGALLGKTPEEIRGYFEQAKAIAYP